MVNTGFMRRNYRDMTADVICLCCFQTIAHSKPVGDLATAEEEHICTPHEDIVVSQTDPLQGLYR